MAFEGEHMEKITGICNGILETIGKNIKEIQNMYNINNFSVYNIQNIYKIRGKWAYKT
jgi:hypothetical protein